MKYRHNVITVSSRLLILLMGILLAGQGTLFADDDIEVEGFIEVIGGNYLVVQNIEFFVDDDTEIENRDGDEISLNELSVGEYVEVEADLQSDSTYLATEIEVEEPEADIEIEGAISEIGTDSLVVNGITVFVDSATVVVDDDDNPIAFGDLQVGDHVEVEAVDVGNGYYLAFLIELDDDDDGQDDEDIEVTGPIEALGDSNLTVAGIEFLVDGNTEVRDDDDNDIDFSDLQVGMIVEVDADIDAAGNAIAREIEIEDFQNDEIELTGDIEAISANDIVVLGKLFDVDSSTAVFDDDNNPISFDVLSVGTLVEIKGQLQPDGSCLATRIKIEDNSQSSSFAGKLEDRSGNSITVNQTVLQVNENTLVRNHANVVVSLDEILLDSDIKVEALTTANGDLLAEEIKLEAGPGFAVSEGSVDAINASQVTIDGLNATIDANTRLLDANYETISWQSIPTGSEVRLWADTDPSGNTIALQVRLTDNVTAIGDLDNAALPGEFELAQNYPNPFNPMTTVPIQIRGSGQYQVNLTIYNLTGQRVKTLVNESLSAGEYQFIWNALNDNQQLLPSGVYMMQLTVDSQPTQSRKMILLK